MFETTQYEVARRLRGTAILTAGVSVLAVFMISIFPSMEASGIDLDAMIESYPPAMREAFGIETLVSIEGFLAVEFYNFVWLLLFGLYFAYSAAGLIADDIERDRMGLLLSFPVARTRLLGEKFASLLVQILVLNAVAALVVYAGVTVIGESIDPVSVGMVHLLSVPYLLVCGGIGLTLSVLVNRAETAKRGAIASVFVLYLVDSITAGLEALDWLQYISPTQYFDPTAILVHGSYDLLNAATLIVMFIGLLSVSQLLFTRRDI